MPTIAQLARWEGSVLLGAFCVTLCWKLLTAKIPLHELLQGDRADGSSYVSSGRIQLLIVTLFASVSYLMKVIHDPRVIPEIPAGLLAALGGSQATYLGGKANALLGLFRNTGQNRRTS
jgi:hypothetical protein